MEEEEEPSSPSRRHLYCDCCGDRQDFDDGDDGFFYCSACGSQSQDLIVTQTAHEDLNPEGAGIYNLHLTRSKPRNPNPNPNPNPSFSRRDLIRALTGDVDSDEDVRRGAAFGFHDDGAEEPRDFGSGPDAGAEGEALADGIRTRYLEGLQVMLESQCEALVERFGASPVVVGVAPAVWLRYVAATGVFADDWAERVVRQSEAKNKKPRKLRYRSKYRSEPHNSGGQRVIYIWLRALKKAVPLYTTLAISFLVCHIAREPILPTDIFKWALEGTLPYLVSFLDMDKFLGNPSNACPFSSRSLFRPRGILQADQLEAVAAKMAQTIGLCLPSVNFYAIARRYLKDLCLPVDKILPHACHLYMWSIPPELWLSSSCGLPTRVCVMSILIVTIRILYNINGQGTWEMSQSVLGKSAPNGHGAHIHSDLTNISSTTMNGCGNGDHPDASGSKAANWFSRFHTSNYNAVEVLEILGATYDKISTTYDYSKDLPSYLKYCKDIIFAGSTTSYEEENIIERLWDMYEKKENDCSEGVKTNFFDVEVKRPRDAASTCSPLDPKEEKNNGGFDGPPSSPKEPPDVSESSPAAGNFALEKMQLDMEENGFQYLPPRVQQIDGYLHYKRQRIDGGLVYVAHADYYILLRSCAKVAHIGAQNMHQSVLKLERRLDWLEQQIVCGLGSLAELSSSK
ncbi:putative TATA box-binding protein-associated factor RNA polymerase I subunit B [Iris pallida]|uniref:TATA box-binding protein-associated factor RNA polymerase I subunit B n=1 Tax=Iris pallida TaxID=29817 RepID=A0AAX6H7A0_IRIPA|nr:putative TATA box-binding protein-associated factor RNA polymerase I subunit B [Iris pallida]